MIRLCAALAGLCLLPATAQEQQGLLEALARQAPELSRQPLQHALAALRCAQGNGAGHAQRLAVIDYSRPSSERRLWLFDLQARRVLLREFVAHGRRSGENRATRFSNREGSFQSSIGLFRAAESYIGKHGYSLRMDGLEAGINDRARERAIVIHGADYVDPQLVRSQGRIGRSLGCPAVRPQVARMLVDELKGGQFVFAWYPDAQWLQGSAYLNCAAGQRLASRSGGRAAAL